MTVLSCFGIEGDLLVLFVCSGLSVPKVASPASLVLQRDHLPLMEGKQA